MIDLTQFTPWTLFTDLGFISILLLVGKFIRVKVKLIQQLFIPPSLIAGLLGLAFGPNGLGWIPLSNDLGTYAAILIALVFGALPLSSPNVSMKEVAKRVGPMWAYAQVGMLLQWALVGLFGLYVIKLIWPDLNDAFGIMLPTGFYGGHGTRRYRVRIRGIGLGRGSQFRHDYCYRRGYLLDHRRFTDGQMGGQA